MRRIDRGCSVSPASANLFGRLAATEPFFAATMGYGERRRAVRART